MLKLFNKHAAIVSVVALLTGGPAFAQSTVLGPSMTTVTGSGTAALAALPANPSRKAVTICNGHATNTVTFTTGSLTPVSLTTGIVLAAGNVATSCFTIGNPSAGPGAAGVGAQINVIASAGSTPITFIEYY